MELALADAPRECLAAPSFSVGSSELAVQIARGHNCRAISLASATEVSWSRNELNFRRYPGNYVRSKKLSRAEPKTSEGFP